MIMTMRLYFIFHVKMSILKLLCASRSCELLGTLCFNKVSHRS
jgi:hypothetical protein